MRLKDCFSSTLWWFLTTDPDYKPMGLCPGGLKSGINFALEPDWAYIWVGLSSGGSLSEILRYSSFFLYQVFKFLFLLYIQVFIVSKESKFSKHDSRSHMVFRSQTNKESYVLCVCF